MGTVGVDQIIINPLQRIQHEMGSVMHAMKCSDRGYSGFGEVYFSEVNAGAVKAWKKHRQMTLNLVVPIGTVQFVFFDNLGDSREEIIGYDNYARLTVPPGIWFGFKGVGQDKNIVMNIADIVHDPSEVDRVDMHSFSYSWG